MAEFFAHLSIVLRTQMARVQLLFINQPIQGGLKINRHQHIADGDHH
jgi:hypothetical protein